MLNFALFELILEDCFRRERPILQSFRLFRQIQIYIAQILCQTNLWGAVPLQLAVQLQKLMPDLIILGRPKNAVVYGPTLIWHNRTHQDPASVWVRSVIVSAPKTLADVNSIHFIED